MGRPGGFAGLALCVLLASPAIAAPPAASSADAESAFVAGRFDEADRAYAAILAQSARDTLALVRRDQMALYSNHLADAKAMVERARDAGASPVRAAGLLGEIAYRQDDYVAAASHFRAAGREAKAHKLESFAPIKPWRVEGPDSVAIPMVQTDPLPVIEMTVNGRGPYFFLIDTGGAEIILDPPLADSLGLARYGDEEGTFGGGRRRNVTHSRVERVGLGGVTIHDVPVGLLDTRRFAGAAGGRYVAGVVGTVLLYHFRATLDYPHGRLVLARREAHGGNAAAEAGEGRIEVPFRMAGDHFIVAPGTVDSSGTVLWFVDSGLAGAAFTAPTSTLIEARIAVPDTASGMTGQGGGGAIHLAPYGVKRLTLGAAAASNLMGLHGPFPASLERAMGFRIAGIISHAFLRAWSVTLDFERMVLVLEKPA